MMKSSEYHEESTREFRPQLEPQVEPRTHLEIGAVTHPGLCRRKNEDNYLAAKLSQSNGVENSNVPSANGTSRSPAEGHVLVVADGMGGVAGGERASAIAIESLETYLRDDYRAFLHTGHVDDPTFFRELKGGIERADLAVFAAVESEPQLTGMGTTVVMAYCLGARVHLMHVGDSRAYLWHDNGLQQITSDHTLVQMMVDDGVLTREDARIHAKRNVVTNIVGGPEPGFYAEFHRLYLSDGDILMLCSDGLTEAVEDSTIASILKTDRPAAELSTELVEAALARGGPDNVTVIVAKAHHII